MSSQIAICKQPVSKTEQPARKWIVILAEFYRTDLTERGPRYVELWVGALSDVEASSLELACRKAMQLYKFFPTPAEIRDALQIARSNIARPSMRSLPEADATPQEIKQHLEKLRKSLDRDLISDGATFSKPPKRSSEFSEACAKGETLLGAANDPVLQEYLRKHGLNANTHS